jgi:hypothetical protein
MDSVQLFLSVATITAFSKSVHAMWHLKVTTLYKYLENNTMCNYNPNSQMKSNLRLQSHSLSFFS